jgi:hypothetical protein
MRKTVEIKRCLVCSTAHMTFADNEALGLIAKEKYNWIMEYEYGFVIDLWEYRYIVLRLKALGLSKAFRKFVYSMILKHDLNMIQFDADGDTIDEMPTYYW